MKTMADSLVLKGVKDVRKHSGNEMKLAVPKRGGDMHQIKDWWRKGVNTAYAGCTVFNVTTEVGTVKLALITAKQENTSIRIDHDGSFNFTFLNISRIERAALFTVDMQLIEHYIFPSIAGGSVVTVTPPGAAERPAPAPSASIDSVSIAGVEAATYGIKEKYTVSVEGDAAPYTYSWSITNGTISAGKGKATITVSWAEAGAGSVTCTVGSKNGDFDGNTVADTLTTTVVVPFSSKVANATQSYAVTVNDEDVFALNGVGQKTIEGSAGDTFHFDLSDDSLSGHPLKIYTDETKTTEVTVGIEQEGTDFLFTPPIAGTFSYQCADHAGMGGTITVS